LGENRDVFFALSLDYGIDNNSMKGAIMRTLLGLAVLIADMLVILDVLKRPLNTGKKALWIIVILVLPIIGIMLYYFIGKKQA
jgi:hypothetical protein